MQKIGRSALAAPLLPRFGGIPSGSLANRSRRAWYYPQILNLLRRSMLSALSAGFLGDSQVRKPKHEMAGPDMLQVYIARIRCPLCSFARSGSVPGL